MEKQHLKKLLTMLLKLLKIKVLNLIKFMRKLPLSDGRTNVADSVLHRRNFTTHIFSTEELTGILIQIFHKDHPYYQQSIKTDYLKTRSLTKIHRSVMAFVDTYNALNTFKYIGIGMSCRKISSQDRQWSDISGIDHDIAIRVVVWHLYLLYLR